MDVIALHQAGFAGAVAPLGTALTEEQLEELWRLSPAPVLCFDGDAAGARAAARSAELALPLLAPDRTLRIAALPPGEDPDTPGAPPGGRAASRPCWTRRARWPRRCTTCCARPAASARRSSGRRSAPGWRRRRGASPTARWPANTARPARPLLRRARRPAPARPMAPRRAFLGRALLGRAAAGEYHPAQPRATASRAAPRLMPSAGRSDAERMRVLTAILLRHPNLLADVEHAYAALTLLPPLDGCATRCWLGRGRGRSGRRFAGDARRNVQCGVRCGVRWRARWTQDERMRRCA